jgi:hypothetical protein
MTNDRPPCPVCGRNDVLCGCLDTPQHTPDPLLYKPTLRAVPPPEPEEKQPQPTNANAIAFLEQALDRARRGDLVGVVITYLGREGAASGSVWSLPPGGAWRTLAIGELTRASTLLVVQGPPAEPVERGPEKEGEPS